MVSMVNEVFGQNSKQFSATVIEQWKSHWLKDDSNSLSIQKYTILIVTLATSSSDM